MRIWCEQAVAGKITEVSEDAVGARVVIIDVDGVVSPVGGAGTLWGDEVVAGDVSGPAIVSPTLCDRLDRLNAVAGVSCVWLTSWSSEMRSHLRPFPGRAWPAVPNPVGADMPEDRWWKLAALDTWLEHHPHVTALAWCDDHLVGDYLTDARRSLGARGLEPLFVVPHTQDGLTADDLGRLTAWANLKV